MAKLKLSVGAREYAEAECRSAIRGAPGPGVVPGDAIAQHPVAVCDKAAVAPSSGYPVSAGNGNGVPGRVQRSHQDGATRAEYFRCRVKGHGSGQPAVAG